MNEYPLLTNPCNCLVKLTCSFSWEKSFSDSTNAVTNTIYALVMSHCIVDDVLLDENSTRLKEGDLVQHTCSVIA